MLNIVLVSGTPLEEQAREQLLRLMERYDLRRWQFTDAVRIETGVIPHSHPMLTLNTRHLDDDHTALSVYIPEQLHWYSRTKPKEWRSSTE